MAAGESAEPSEIGSGEDVGQPVGYEPKKVRRRLETVTFDHLSQTSIDGAEAASSSSRFGVVLLHLVDVDHHDVELSLIHI